jgi:ankyrin repeat protein
MPVKSKRTPNDSITDDENLDDVLAELRAQDARDGRTQDSSSTSTSSNTAVPGDHPSEEVLDATVSNTELDRWLAEKGLTSVDEADGKGRTPLWIAAEEGDVEKVRWLVEIGTASVDQAENRGETPLWIAVKNGLFEIIFWLLKTGKASVDQADNMGQTPLWIAAHDGHFGIVC